VLHHVTLWVPDLARAEESWSWLLGELGYSRDSAIESVLLFRHAGGVAIALEESSDMVPGMLYSRMRPGLNHMAFTVDSREVFDRLLANGHEYGWATLPVDGHLIAGGALVAYLEDRDGFEVELVMPTAH
jgi:catechol 2,3-dioxygenase-like lactoylglutathione lyase family enzyme